MKHHLTVKIEKRFKKQLSKRFTSENATEGWFDTKEICISCSLCDEYWLDGDKKDFCRNCPFNVYRNENIGCLDWILRVVGKRWIKIITLASGCIEWNKKNNKEAIQLLKKLREEAKKYIIWTENTK